MTSQIVFSTIDEQYPKAGIDNNSQGFRDNFNIIKEGLSTANGEITTLQNNTAKTDTDNDFNGNIIANAEIRRLSGSVSPLGNVSSNTVLDTREADYFTATVTSGNAGSNPPTSVTFTLAFWPATGLHRTVRVQLRGDDAGFNRAVVFATSGGGSIVREVDQPVTVPSSITPYNLAGPLIENPGGGYYNVYNIGYTVNQYHIFEFTTNNGGSTVFCKYIGKFGVA